MFPLKRIGAVLLLAGLLLAMTANAWTDGLSSRDISLLNQMNDAARRVGLGTKLNQALTGVPEVYSNYSLFWAGNLGHDVGPGTDGVLFGALTPTNPTKFYLAGYAKACLAIAADGGAYTVETTGANEATTNDVTLVPATGAENDAYYIGHATERFASTQITITTAGNFVGQVAWEYWDGDKWTALDDIVDGTTAFSAAAGTVTVAWTLPTDWAKCTVHSVNGYWVRGRITTATSGGGAKAGRVYVVSTTPTWTDLTTAFTNATTGDAALLPAKTVAGDASYIGYTAGKFAKLKLTYSQARVGGTVVIEYSKGSTWGTLTCADNTTTLSAAAGTKWISWVPPTDWAPATVNGTSAYWIRFRCSVEGVTTQPLASQGWVQNFTAGDGIAVNRSGTVYRVQMTAQTASASNADSKFLLINLTKGTWDDFTWTKADVMDSETVSLAVTAGDKLSLAQVAEDGSTEFANCNFLVSIR